MAHFQRRLLYKVYSEAGTYLGIIDDITSDFSIRKQINGGDSEFSFTVSRKFDDFDEDGTIKFNNRVKVYLTDSYNPSGNTLIANGYIVSYSPTIKGKNEGVEVTCLSAVSKLSNDFFRTGNALDASQLGIQLTTLRADQMMEAIIDHYRTIESNSMISNDYTNASSTTDNVGASITFTHRFFNMKHLDALRESAKFLPKNKTGGFWQYWRIETDGTLWVKNLSTTPDHSFIIGKHIKEIDGEKSMVDIVNRIYFWNEKGTVDPDYINLTNNDATSQSTYDIMSSYLTDSKITNAIAASLLTTAQLYDGKDPKVVVKVTLTGDYDLASIRPGQTCNLLNAKNNPYKIGADNVLLIESIEYNVDSATLYLSNGHVSFTDIVQEERDRLDKEMTWFGFISQDLTAAQLAPADRNWVTDITFTSATGPDAYRNVTWIAGKVYIPAGASGQAAVRQVAAGSSGLLTAGAQYVIYLDELNKPTTSASETGTAGIVQKGSNFLTDSSKAWTTNQWQGYVVTINSEKQIIRGNTTTVLTTEEPIQQNDFTGAYNIAKFAFSVTNSNSVAAATTSVIFSNVKANTVTGSQSIIIPAGNSSSINIDGGTQIAQQSVTGGTAGAIAALTVTAANIANATITGAQIANATITATQIANASITGAQIALATITAANITAATITGAQIALATISASNIQTATITGTQIASGTITATNIAAATITATQIANATITGAKIATATITATNITAGTITATEIQAATITGTQIANGTIAGTKIASATITSANIASATILGANIAAGTITGGLIQNATIVAANIVSGTITGTQIAASAGIVGSQIGNLTINAANIANLTITGGKIASSTITNDNVNIGSFMNIPSDANMKVLYDFDAGSGTVLTDGTRNALDGVISGATWVQGRTGNALNFDGVSNVVTTADATPIQNLFDAGGSVSVWIRPTTGGEGGTGIVYTKIETLSVKNDNGLAVDLELSVPFSTTTGVFSTSGRPVTTAAWHHIAIVYNNAAVGNLPVLYIDGVLTTMTAGPAPVGTRTTNVGTSLLIGNNAATTRTFAGQIDEFRFYKALLTSAEAQALFLNPAGNNSARFSGVQLVAQSISTVQLAAGSVTATNIAVTNLASINSNMGTIVAGNITLDTAGFLRGGQAAFDTGSGFFLGWQSTAYKFSIGDGGANKVTWNGTDLIVKARKSNLKIYEAVVDAAGDGDYLTVSAALTAGATRIYVRNGGYGAEPPWSTSAADVIIEGESRGGVQITFANSGAGRSIYVNGSNFQIRSMNLSADSSTSQTLFFFDSNAVQSTVDNCKVRSDNGGVFVANAQGLVVQNCYVDARSTISVSNWRYVSSANNSLFINNIIDMDALGGTITVIGSAGGCVFMGNRFLNTGVGNISIGGGNTTLLAACTFYGATFTFNANIQNCTVDRNSNTLGSGSTFILLTSAFSRFSDNTVNCQQDDIQVISINSANIVCNDNFFNHGVQIFISGGVTLRCISFCNNMWVTSAGSATLSIQSSIIFTSVVANTLRNNGGSGFAPTIVDSGSGNVVANNIAVM